MSPLLPMTGSWYGYSPYNQISVLYFSLEFSWHLFWTSDLFSFISLLHTKSLSTWWFHLMKVLVCCDQLIPCTLMKKKNRMRSITLTAMYFFQSSFIWLYIVPLQDVNTVKRKHRKWKINVNPNSILCWV